jgi:hypothetical protein
MRMFSFLFVGIVALSACLDPAAVAVTLESRSLALDIDATGALIALRHGPANHLAAGEPAPILQLRIGQAWHQPIGMSWDATAAKLQLRYSPADVTATIRVTAKPTHIVCELVALEEPAEGVELVLWGPYPTTIGEIVGETVGVVRNQETALGIQSLNAKTLGGYPGTEDEIMPMYDIFAGTDLSDIASDQRDKELYRGDTARPTPFGSVLQAYCRNRSRDRIIANWGHTHYLAPAFNDGGVIGSRIALFACPAAEALTTIGRIELAEGLPHPMLDGAWAKTAPSATASYLIIDFGEATLDAALELTRQAGLRYLYHGGPFRTWGHFELRPDQFPDGWASLKRCVDRAEKVGVRLGVHTLSNFITPNDAYVTPEPDPRLAKVGATHVTAAVDAAQTEIPVAEPIWFSQMQNNTLKTAVVGKELIRYGSVSEAAPWRLLDCERGGWGTQAAAHPAGEPIAKLMDHGYRVFLTNPELSLEVARRIGDLFNETGLRQVSFDGLEGNWSTGLGQYGRTLFTQSWFDRLSPALRGQVINDASNPGHFTWHIYTRMNWGEPWYAGFRESQTQYRLKNQNYYARNLMPPMLGWFQMNAETTLEDAEWLLARAAGFDAGFCLVTSPDTVRQNGAGDTILAAIHHWETARLAGAFPDDAKVALRNIQHEFQLKPVGDHRWNLYPVTSFKGVHNRREQPGMITTTEFHFEHPHAAQPLQFILRVTGKNEVSDLVLELNGREAVAFATPLAAGQILRYAGAESLVRCNAQGRPLETIAVNQNRLQVASGKTRIRVGARLATGDDVGLKCEFRTVGVPRSLSQPAATDIKIESEQNRP